MNKTKHLLSVLASLLLLHASCLAKPTCFTDTTLKERLEQFIQVSDKGDFQTVSRLYDPDFSSVRVIESTNKTIKMSREQMLAFFQQAHSGSTTATKPILATKETTIQSVDEQGEAGYVLLTRIKDLGNGWEPLFYVLVWRKRAGSWYLLREFVHQRTAPRW